MAAGHSAADQAALFQLEAEHYEYAAKTAREMHRRYSAAASSERALGALLEPLQERGFHVLSDRKWPRTRGKAQVDFVLVGPSGICIVDAKTWADVQVVGDRVFQGQDDVTDRFDATSGIGQLVREDLTELGLAPGEVRVAAVFTNRRGIRSAVNGVDLLGIDGAVPYLLRGERLSPVQVELARERVAALFPPQGENERPLLQRIFARPEPVIPITRQEALITAQELEESLLAHESAKPIEEWMAWLHPEQAKLARRSFSGAVAHPRIRRHGQDRRRPASRRAPHPHPTRPRARHHLRAHSS